MGEAVEEEGVSTRARKKPRRSALRSTPPDAASRARRSVPDGDTHAAVAAACARLPSAYAFPVLELLSLFHRDLLEHAAAPSDALRAISHTLPRLDTASCAALAARVFAGWIDAWRAQRSAYRGRIAADGTLRLDNGFTEFIIKLPAAVLFFLEAATAQCEPRTLGAQDAGVRAPAIDAAPWRARAAAVLLGVPRALAAAALGHPSTSFEEALIHAVAPRMEAVLHEIVENPDMRGFYVELESVERRAYAQSTAGTCL